MGEPSSAAACTDWLDAHAIPDARLGAAYESLGNNGRAALKQCIARLHSIWGELPSRLSSDTRYGPDFRLVTEETPADFALVVCAAAYPHPAALLAAVMPAVLGGVEDILPCFVRTDARAGVQADTQGSPPAAPLPATPLSVTALSAAPLLAAMELAGIERCFAARADECGELLRMLDAARPGGRLVILGPPGFCADLCLEAHSLGVACRSFNTPPRFERAGSGGLVEQRFGEALPENIPVPLETAAGEKKGQPLLRLDEKHEHVWLWPDLSPAWFRNRRMSFSS